MKNRLFLLGMIAFAVASLVGCRADSIHQGYTSSNIINPAKVLNTDTWDVFDGDGDLLETWKINMQSGLAKQYDEHGKQVDQLKVVFFEVGGLTFADVTVDESVYEQLPDYTSQQLQCMHSILLVTVRDENNVCLRAMKDSDVYTNTNMTHHPILNMMQERQDDDTSVSFLTTEEWTRVLTEVAEDPEFRKILFYSVDKGMDLVAVRD